MGRDVLAALADAVVVAHGLFVLFAVLGGLLVLRWPCAAWLHLPALAWGLWIELSGGVCPLTPLEWRLREAAGEAAYEAGFVANYLVPLIYPPGLTGSTQWLLAGGLAAVNLIVYWIVVSRLRARRPQR
jgi:hypothetical protein